MATLCGLGDLECGLGNLKLLSIVSLLHASYLQNPCRSLVGTYCMQISRVVQHISQCGVKQQKATYEILDSVKGVITKKFQLGVSSFL